MQVTVFLIQDTTNIINHSGCSLSAADHHGRSTVWTHDKGIIHSVVYMFSPLVGLVYTAQRHADWPCDVTSELSLSGFWTDSGQFLRALTNVYHLYQRSQCSLTEEFSTFFGKTTLWNVPVYKYVQQLSMGYFWSLLTLCSTFSSSVPVWSCCSCKQRKKEFKVEMPVELRRIADDCDSNRTYGKCGVWLRINLAVHTDKQKGEPTPVF